MKHKVICSECETLLEPGEDPPVFKKCIKCVLETTPAADLSKVVDATGKTFESREKARVKKGKEKMLQIMTEMYTQEVPGEDRPRVLLVFKIIDYFKRPVFEFGCDFQQVEEWHKFMKGLHDEIGNSDSSK